MEHNDDRLLPRDIEAEKALLGGMMLYSTGYESPLDLKLLQEIVPPEALTDEHQRIYLAVITLADAKKAIDLVAVRDAIGLEVADLIMLAEVAPPRVDVLDHARRVRKCWRLRRLIEVADEAEQRAYCPDADVSELIHWTLAQLDTIRDA